jgi:hypothetical protein
MCNVNACVVAWLKCLNVDQHVELTLPLPLPLPLQEPDLRTPSQIRSIRKRVRAISVCNAVQREVRARTTVDPRIQERLYLNHSTASSSSCWYLFELRLRTKSLATDPCLHPSGLKCLDLQDGWQFLCQEESPPEQQIYINKLAKYKMHQILTRHKTDASFFHNANGRVCLVNILPMVRYTRIESGLLFDWTIRHQQCRLEPALLLQVCKAFLLTLSCWLLNKSHKAHFYTGWLAKSIVNQNTSNIRNIKGWTSMFQWTEHQCNQIVSCNLRFFEHTVDFSKF